MLPTEMVLWNIQRKTLNGISKSTNFFESEPNTDVYPPAFTALKKSYQIARC